MSYFKNRHYHYFCSAYRKFLPKNKRRQYFYNVVTEEQKAEFINGEIVVHSPVKLRHHRASTLLHRLLSTYSDVRGLGYVGYEKLLIVLTRNDYEPNVCFFAKKKRNTLCLIK